MSGDSVDQLLCINHDASVRNYRTKLESDFPANHPKGWGYGEAFPIAHLLDGGAYDTHGDRMVFAVVLESLSIPARDSEPDQPPTCSSQHCHRQA